ncbi:NUDIX domain-containing protein [Paenibacillus sp. LMG 31458]|uniref:NUDIX domain-containing protein n=1 Tax=Paenibacillus phytorum TaxID=2654977 RepID=A0ABX1XR49_9BACL|nr:8-oxo-dGTP diphosphatase [Paenibacillus phytorum]NOU70952.1 NUDIX domain-containing protein [Paenibacillus phytorum]
MSIKYVHCFIYKDNQFLMLRRNNPPFKNMWNCVGGKIMLDETPRDAVIREVKEETGLTLQSVHFKGIATWNQAGGMYIFLAEQFIGDLIECNEGTLDWKSKEWIMQSPDVVSSIPTILEDVLTMDVPVEFALFYTGVEYEGDIWEYVILKAELGDNI